MTQCHQSFSRNLWDLISRIFFEGHTVIRLYVISTSLYTTVCVLCHPLPTLDQAWSLTRTHAITFPRWGSKRSQLLFALPLHPSIPTSLPSLLCLLLPSCSFLPSLSLWSQSSAILRTLRKPVERPRRRGTESTREHAQGRQDSQQLSPLNHLRGEHSGLVIWTQPPKSTWARSTQIDAGRVLPLWQCVSRGGLKNGSVPYEALLLDLGNV